MHVDHQLEIERTGNHMDAAVNKHTHFSFKLQYPTPQYKEVWFFSALNG